MDQEHLDSVLYSYAYGLPFIRLRGTTDPVLLKNPLEWTMRVEDCHPTPKVLQTIDQHPICSLFASKEAIPPIARTILQTAAKHTPGLIGLDILRIGYRDDRFLPVVLIITVKPNTTTWEQGCLIAREVLQVVRQYDSDLDVQCEVYETNLTGHTFKPRDTVPKATVPETTVPETTVPETTVSQTTAPEATVPEATVAQTTIAECDANTSFFYPIQENWDVHRMFNDRNSLLCYTPYLGQSISASSEPSKAGSTGLYVRLSKDEQSICALVTARNVVCPDGNTSNINRLDSTKETTEAPIKVFQVSQREAKKVQANFQDFVDDVSKEIRIRTKAFLEGALAPEVRSFYLDMIQYMEKDNRFLEHVNQFSQADKRHIGDVVASPTISTAGNKRHDWAVIKLNEHLYGQHSPRNRVYIANLRKRSRNRLKATDSTLLVCGRRERVVASGSDEDFLEVKTFFTTEDLEERKLFPVLPVYMHGAKTKGTDGNLNKLYFYKWDSETDITREYCVVGLGARKYFSMAGDGGSAVFTVLDVDNNGTTQPTAGVLGFLWGGTDLKKNSCWPSCDISYVTPFEHVKDSFEEFTGWKMALA